MLAIPLLDSSYLHQEGRARRETTTHSDQDEANLNLGHHNSVNPSSDVSALEPPSRGLGLVSQQNSGLRILDSPGVV